MKEKRASLDFSEKTIQLDTLSNTKTSPPTSGKGDTATPFNLQISWL